MPNKRQAGERIAEASDRQYLARKSYKITNLQCTGKAEFPLKFEQAIAWRLPVLAGIAKSRAIPLMVPGVDGM